MGIAHIVSEISYTKWELLLHQEPIGKRIGLIDHPVRKAADGGSPAHLGDDGVELPDLCFTEDTSFEDCPDDGFVY